MKPPSRFRECIGYEFDTRDVLNLGMAQKILVENVNQRFLEP